MPNWLKEDYDLFREERRATRQEINSSIFEFYTVFYRLSFMLTGTNCISQKKKLLLIVSYVLTRKNVYIS